MPNLFNYRVFFLIRYSVLATAANREWAITARARDSKGDVSDRYEKELFSDRRLLQHERMFTAITLPGLRSAPRNASSIGIFTSDRLPDRWLEGLNAAIVDVPNAEVVKLPLVRNFGDSAKAWVRSKLESTSQVGTAFATVRLDDDDALAEDYVSCLEPYVNEHFAGMAVSFPLGYRGVWNGSAFTELTETYLSKTSQGLAHINYFDAKTAAISIDETVFSRASHRTLDRHSPVILDARRRVYIRTVHDAQDTVAGSFLQNSWRRIQRYAESPASNNEISSRFALEDAILPATDSPRGRRSSRLQRLSRVLWNPNREA